MTIKIYKDTLIVFLSGDVDQHKVSSIKDEIDYQIKQCKTRNLIFDFSEVEFMDSSGIGMVLSRYKNLTSTNGQLSLSGVSENTMKLFDMVGLRKIIKIRQTVDECLVSF